MLLNIGLNIINIIKSKRYEGKNDDELLKIIDEDPEIMDLATAQYIDNKITFDDMVSMIGFENTRRLDAAVKGVEKSLKEADSLAVRIGRKKY